MLVALILLAAITIIGVANMQSSNMEMSMINAQKTRHENFTIAEALLTESEANLSASNLVRDNLLSNKCAATSTQICFNDSCTGGFCFDGTYDTSSRDELECLVSPDSDSLERVQYWEDSSIWSNGGNTHREIELSLSGETLKGKYVAEFLCFLGRNIYNDPATGDALFRISMLYEPDMGQPILLQSTYSFEINR